MTAELMARNLAALTSRTDRGLRDFISGILPDNTDTDAMWTLLYSPALCERTVVLLTELVADIDHQFAVANQTGEVDPDWAKKALKFKYLVTMRLGRAKYTLKQQNVTASSLASAWQATAHQLAAAIRTHQHGLADDIDTGPADHELWNRLDTITRPDGTPVRQWMDNHKERGAA